MYVWRSSTTRTSLTGTQEVGEAVAEQREADPDEDDRDPGQGRQPPGGEDVVLPVGDHHAPLRRRRLGAETEEAESRAEKDVLYSVDHREDDHERDGVRQDVSEHHASVRVAERLRCEDVLLTLRDE